jgi:hypothetical protein
MRGRLLVTALLLLAAVLQPVTAYAAGPTNAHTGVVALTLTSWPVLLAGGVGWLSSQVTAFLTHKAAPQWIKSGIHLALSTLAGALITITVTPASSWKDYAALIATTWGAGIISHVAGWTQLVANTTWNVGVGAGVPPIVPPAPGVTETQDAAQGESVF